MLSLVSCSFLTHLCWFPWIFEGDPLQIFKFLCAVFSLVHCLFWWTPAASVCPVSQFHLLNAGYQASCGFPSLHCNMELSRGNKRGQSWHWPHLVSFFSGFTVYFLMICIFYSVLVVSYGRVNPYYSIWPEAKVIYLILFSILPVFLLFQFEQLQAELSPLGLEGPDWSLFMSKRFQSF